MKNEIKQFLNDIVAICDDEKLVAKAKELLDEDFKEEIANIFDYSIKHYDNVVEAIRKKDYVEFVCRTKYQEDAKDFLNENYGKLDLIIDILNEMLGEQENE